MDRGEDFTKICKKGEVSKKINHIPERKYFNDLISQKLRRKDMPHSKT
jgi:hypothetical protein